LENPPFNKILNTPESPIYKKSHFAEKFRHPIGQPNPLLPAKIDYIDYKDTNLLRKFISDRGKIRDARRRPQLPRPPAAR
jgi:ribosomal protein S18